MAAKGTQRRKSTQRKLTAILCADVVGYSRLMGADEEATIETLTAYRKVFLSEIESHSGRVVDAKGDAILAEFASVVDAVSGAVEIQRELAEKNTELPDDRRMDFRIGINLGDVVVKDDVIYGDGVNIAARLESLAEPGGICVSGSAYAQVRNKLPLEYEFLGNKEVKNIAEPVPAFRVLSVPGGAAHRIVGAKKKIAGKWRRAVLAAAVVILIAGGGLLAWNFYQKSAVETALAAFAKSSEFPLPDRPSIAVLAFDNMSGDPKQEYFSDGISENIITRLAKWPPLFVISRRSSFTYKGKETSIRQVGLELGVRYVLEGSVQKSGDQIRITAQLIDAATGRHIWADSFDRELNSLFVVMDEITRMIVTEVGVQIIGGEKIRYGVHDTDNVEAYDLMLKAGGLWLRFEKGANAHARELITKAIELDPKYSRAMAMMGWAHLNDSRYRWVKDRKHSFRLAQEWARKALAIDGSLGTAHGLMSRIYTIQGDYEKAIAAGERAIEAEPGSANDYATFSLTMSFAGDPQRALPLIQKAMRLSPFHGINYLAIAADAYFLQGRYEEAQRFFERILKRTQEGFLARLSRQRLIAIHMELGRDEQARAMARKILESNPDYSLKMLKKRLLKAPFKDKTWMEAYLENLRQAGLPE